MPAARTSTSTLERRNSVFHTFRCPLEPNGAGCVAALAAAGAHVSHARRGVGNLPRLPDARGGFQGGVYESLADFQPLLPLEVPQQGVHLYDVGRALHLGQQDAVEVRAEHCLQITAGQSGFQAIHSHHDGLASFAQFLHHPAHRLAGRRFLVGRNRVLQVQDQGVGPIARGLAHPIFLVARDEHLGPYRSGLETQLSPLDCYGFPVIPAMGICPCPHPNRLPGAVGIFALPFHGERGIST